MSHSMRSYLLRCSEEELQQALENPDIAEAAYPIIAKILENRRVWNELYCPSRLEQMPTEELNRALQGLLRSDDSVGTEKFVLYIVYLLSKRDGVDTAGPGK